ncbi:MAG TPA: hypothetical protein VFN35_08885 [Ktedonobacteraceae bacterium]|nr:hypothetical protein [Ktedonobacteraceae bacterium]
MNTVLIDFNARKRLLKRRGNMHTPQIRFDRDNKNNRAFLIGKRLQDGILQLGWLLR